MLLPALISSLTNHTTSADTYLVALTQDGLVVGSAVVGNVSQTTIAVWGDDASTSNVVDGAASDELISFQLVDGTNLYDVEMPAPVSYTTNGMMVQSVPAISVTVIDCTDIGCTLPSSDVLNTGSNMTLMLTPALISSLTNHTTSADTYLVALTQDGLVVGSTAIEGEQTTMAIFGDDPTTPEVDGAAAAETISFQLVDDTKLYDVVMPVLVSYTTNGLSVQMSSAVVTAVNCE